jgi:hypothetical protein
MLSPQQFWDTNPEDGDHNQYWYSNSTIDRIIEDQVEQLSAPDAPAGGRIAGFLSTPSLYFTLPDELRKQCFVFDVSLSVFHLYVVENLLTCLLKHYLC